MLSFVIFTSFISTVISGSDISWFLCPGTLDLTSVTVNTFSQYSNSCQPMKRLGTVLSTQLENRNKTDYTDNIFYGQNLQLYPDMYETGSSFYTYWYVGIFDYQENINENIQADNIKLTFGGINYRPEFYVNGNELFDEEGPASGMYRYYTLDITSVIVKNSSSSNQNIISVLVNPPDFIGSAENGGQGGDHQVARNGAIMQCTLGWDWIQATPDRNTGIYDKVIVSNSGFIGISNSYAFTNSINYETNLAQVGVEFTVTNNDAKSTHNAIATISIEDSNNTTVGTLRIFLKNLSPGSSSIIKSSLIDIENANLWWPHTHGDPYLYTVSIVVRMSSSSSSSLISAQTLFRHGIRMVQAYQNEVTQGWAFKVNNVDVFIIGGNWIATDQLLRYSNGDAESLLRYRREVGLHKGTGMNLIRVWGGGVAERSEFYDACDELGMLVHQEFWMTGDNNGRWGGDYSWPDDYSSYLLNAKHTILRVRKHASLLLWCGGNELNPKNKSPPAEVAAGLISLTEEHDPFRFYIASSMAPSDPDNGNDANYSLAPTDGPYNITFESSWYNSRNPGLVGYENIPISYQPELGSVSSPVYKSLIRFMPPETLSVSGLPQYLSNEKEPGPVWVYHKYITFTTSGYDHIYAYNPPSSLYPSFVVNAVEYDWRSQLSQYRQYQALFEGYLQYQWKYYAAILMWKSQSPWPAFRGAMYDYYLDYTGSFWGTHAATRCVSYPSETQQNQVQKYAALHVLMNPTSRQLTLINRLPNPAKNVAIVVEISDLTGNILSKQTITVDLISGNGIVVIDNPINWPAQSTSPSDVLLFLISIDDKGSSSSSQLSLPFIYWLSNPVNGDLHDYSSLGTLREESNAQVEVVLLGGGIINSENRHSWMKQDNFFSSLSDKNAHEASKPILLALNTINTDSNDNSSVFYQTVQISCAVESPSVSFALRINLLNSLLPSSMNNNDNRVLPTFLTNSYFTLLPGQNTSIVLATRLEDTERVINGNYLSVEVEGWNVPNIQVKI